MRVMILVDGSFARREQSMLARLEIGLAGEGVRVVRAVPEDCLADIPGMVSSPVVGYEEGVGRLTRRGRARRLVAAASAALEIGGASDEPWFDVVHCLGQPACEIAIEAARMTGAGVALEVWSGDAVGRARELVVARAGRADEPPLVLFAADAAIASILTSDAQPGGESVMGAVELTPWGAHVPPVMRPLPDVAGGGPISVAVLADGFDARAVLALVDALGELSLRFPSLLIFFDADVGSRLDGGRAVWQRAKQRGMLGRFSMVGSMEGHREPILHVDILLQPEAIGAHHSLTLDAMAAGVVVVAREDPLVESLIDGRTAVLVRSGAAAEWVGAIEGVLRDTARTQRLRESAREYVREHRSASRHVGAVMRGYERVVGMQAAT